MCNQKVDPFFLSNAELISRLESLVISEKETTAEIIRHLAEIDSRRLYAELGYSSLFDYAVKNLGYSESAATRRIKVARAGRKLPELFSYLEEDKVTLSSLNICSELLLGENGKEVLEELKDKSKDQAEWLRASYQPVSKIRDNIQKVVVGQASSNQGNLFISDENSSYNRCERNERYKVTFSADEEFMEKLGRVQELMFTGKSEDQKLEKVFGEALDLFIEKHCPKEREERREARQAKKQVNLQLKKSWNLRYIPIGLRDQVLKRDEYRCSYEVLYGRCTCPIGLEIDHIVPFAKGGRTEFENLRVLCSTHHMLATRKEFGREFIDQKIEQARV